jgi:dihydroxy-acid dehydratase
MLADFRPSGKYVMEDLHRVGGTPGVIRMLIEAGVIDGAQRTITGKTLQENVKDLPALLPYGTGGGKQDIVHPIAEPLKRTGHIRILRGSLAPDGAVAKITGKEGTRFTGPARCFDSEEAMIRGVEQKLIKKGDVILIRYEGPRGGPGMPEMLTPTSLLAGAGMLADVALITDGRFSGGSHGFIIGHVTPEAIDGGPIALARDGDRVTIDADADTITLEVSEDELSKRRAGWQRPPYKATRGTLFKYIKNVKTASEGCVTDE